ncbi:hypothetical protein MRB53_040608 [Persea americana]|nr:hypothetical protein MRB53_040608 [Persea americana]
MPTQDDVPGDDDVRNTYNFAPGSYGLVYRADVPDWGAGERPHRDNDEAQEPALSSSKDQGSESRSSEPQYRLQAMKWGTPSPAPARWGIRCSIKQA